MSADGVPSHDDRLQGAGDRAFRVLVLFLTFDPEKTKGVRAVLGDFFKAREGIEFTVVEIDNANEQREWQSASTEGWPCRAFAVGGEHVSKRISLSGQTVKPYTIFDASITKGLGFAELMLRVDNMFDKVYAASGFSARSGHFPGEPRTFLAELRFQF